VIYYRTTPVPVFTIPPNWKTAPKIAEDHGGLVREALSTAEDRRADRHRSLWSISYKTLTLTAQEMGYIRKVLETPEALPFACGFWPLAAKLASPGVQGTPYVTIDDLGATLFDILPYAMLWSAFDTFELVRVAIASASTVQFTTGLATNWPAGTWLVPVTTGALKRPDSRSLTDANDEFKVDFSERFYADEPYFEQAAGGTQAYELQPLELVGAGGPVL
jgi:hypothetical protein